MENRARPLVREMGWGRLSLPCLFVQKQGPKSQGTQSDACTQTVTPPLFFQVFFCGKGQKQKLSISIIRKCVTLITMHVWNAFHLVKRKLYTIIQ